MKKENDTVKMSCYVNETDKKDIKEHCKKIGLSESSYIRMLIMKDLKKSN